MCLRWWCHIFQASNRASERLWKATCPSSYVTVRSEVCDQIARGHITWWEQVRPGMRQVEKPSHTGVPVASCGWTLVTEGLLLILEEKLWQQGAGNGPDWQGADFTHQLWVRSLSNEVPGTGTQHRSSNSSFATISGARSYFWSPPPLKVWSFRTYKP